MTLQALPALDYYYCSECIAVVSYQRGELPEGWAHNLCDPCDAADRARGQQRLEQTVSEGMPAIDPDADVTALPAHLDPFADDTPPQQWLRLSDADLVDLTDHLELI